MGNLRLLHSPYTAEARARIGLELRLDKTCFPGKPTARLHSELSVISAVGNQVSHTTDCYNNAGDWI